MKWLFLSIAVLVVGAVSAFAIYTWGWRDEGPSTEEERIRALAFAQVACSCRQPDELKQVSPGLWRGREGADCFLIDVDDAELSRGALTQGGAAVPC